MLAAWASFAKEIGKGEGEEITKCNYNTVYHYITIYSYIWNVM